MNTDQGRHKRVVDVAPPSFDNQGAMPSESLLQAMAMDESGFARNVLNTPEEDCWNDL